MSNPNIFATIRKVDEEKRLVYGRIAEEAVDKSGEIMDYAKSKPYFQNWSDEIAKDTDGQSLGNVRAMHGKVAAGKLTGIDFNDAEKAVDVCAKVVDDQEWQKVLEGVYTGFSIGGAYVGDVIVEKVNGRDVRRYTAKPSEVSLVDRPCMPSARFFQVQKADGATVEVEFQKVEDEASIEGTPEQVDELTKLMNANGLNVGNVIELIQRVADGTLGKVAEREDVSAAAEYGDVKYADETNKKYPIDTEAHIRAAWNYISKEANAAKYSAEDVGKIKSAIAAAWKDKISKEGPPAAAEKLAKAHIAELRKDLYGCSNFASVIGALVHLRDCAQAESLREGDDSDIPGRLTALIAAAGVVLKDMIDEEIGEEQEESSEIETLELSEQAGELVKSFEGNPFEVLAKHYVSAQQSVPAALPDLQKLLDDATAPLTKLLTEATERIAKLEAQPEIPRVMLKAVNVSKALDGVADAAHTVAMIKDDMGADHPAATLIKQLQQTGGAPLAYRG